jgi:hypothetical protein
VGNSTLKQRICIIEVLTDSFALVEPDLVDFFFFLKDNTARQTPEVLGAPPRV